MKCGLDTFLTWHFSPRASTYFPSAVCTSCARSVCLSPPGKQGALWWLQSSLLLKWLQPVHIICVLCLSSANVTFMRLSDLVAEAEQTVWCWREQSEGLAQISPNTQGRFIINISEKKRSVDALQVCLLRTQSLRMMKIRSRKHQEPSGHYTTRLGSPPARFGR